MSDAEAVGLDVEPEGALVVQFQRGPRSLPDSTPGLFMTHLLAIAIDWLERAQQTAYACEANARALNGLRGAMSALITRRDERETQGVLGTASTHHERFVPLSEEDPEELRAAVKDWDAGVDAYFRDKYGE